MQTPAPVVARHCSRPWKQITFLSDGEAVCSCVDVAKTMPLGNVNELSMEEIWNGPAYKSLRQDCIEDISRRPVCTTCPNRIPEAPKNPENLDVEHRPRHAYIETVAACNLVCPGCDREAIEGSRNGARMSVDTFKKIIDGLSPHLEYLEYHVGGENWAHKQSAEMLRYAKANNPYLFTLTSTNGLYFNTEAQRRDALLSGIDVIIMSIDGATAESYDRYRVRGDFNQVVENMRAMIKMREEMHVSWPKIVWRYILFNWNDSDEEMNMAREMAKEMGVDWLTWLLDVAPTDEYTSRRFRHGSPELEEIRHEMWETVQGMIPVAPRWEDY